MKKFLLVCAVLAGGITAMAQSVEDILAKHAEAVGGKAAWAKVNSLRYEGTLTVQGTPVSIVRTVLKDKGVRLDISVMGMEGYQIMTPTEAWSYMPFYGDSEKKQRPAEEVKQNQDELQPAGSLIFYKETGAAVELAGKQPVDGVECYNIKVREKSGKVNNYFIDVKTNYVLRKTGKAKGEDGSEQEIATTFANYQKQPEGVVLPMTIVQAFGEITISKLEVNKPVDEKIFKPE